jgi:hypothetical protein
MQQPTSNDGFDWSVTFRGSVVSDGGASITNYGFEYTRPGTPPNPNPTTLVFNTGDVQGNEQMFEKVKDSLSDHPGVHSVKAFAVNSTGTGYSQTKTFTVVTAPFLTLGTPVVDGNLVTITGHVINDGGASVTDFGFIINDVLTGEEVPFDPSQITGSPGNYSLTLNLLSGEYQVFAKATNSKGDGYSAPASFLID